MKRNTKAYALRRTRLRDLRQGGTLTPWTWRMLRMPGTCENYTTHPHDGMLGRDLYRGTLPVGHQNADGQLLNGQIYTTGSLCGDCAIGREIGDAIKLDQSASARRAGKTRAVVESVRAAAEW